MSPPPSPLYLITSHHIVLLLGQMVPHSFRLAAGWVAGWPGMKEGKNQYPEIMEDLTSPICPMEFMHDIIAIFLGQQTLTTRENSLPPALAPSIPARTCSLLSSLSLFPYCCIFLTCLNDIHPLTLWSPRKSYLAIVIFLVGNMYSALV